MHGIGEIRKMNRNAKTRRENRRTQEVRKLLRRAFDLLHDRATTPFVGAKATGLEIDLLRDITAATKWRSKQ